MKFNSVKLPKRTKTVAPHFFFGTELDANSSSQQFLLSMYNSVQTSIFIVDVLEDGDFRYFAINPTHEKWLGISSEELQGKKPEDILSPVDAFQVRQNYHECVRLGKTISYKQCLQLQGIHTFWSTTLTPLKNTESKIYRLIGTSIHVSNSDLFSQSQLTKNELQNQVKYLQQKIELQQQEYTLKSKNIHNCHNLIRQITEKIRDNLDIDKILETVVIELSKLWELKQCQIELYDHQQTVAKTRYQANYSFRHSQVLTKSIVDFPEIYQPLLEKKTLQSVEVIPDNYQQIEVIAQIACPIFDVQGNLGNIWLTRSTTEEFNDIETSLVQEIANQCAIAIRQSQLREKTKTQLKEIEKRERHKNEFLKTLSQELRAQITNIHLATQTLETLLTSSGIVDIESVPQLLQILHQECGRESKLINDLLTLSSLKIEPEPPTLISIELENWLNSIAASFRDIVYLQKQQLIVNIPPQLPPLTTDITDFESIISKLINHSCQCTPPGESIIVFANLDTDMVEIKVSYTGIEIPTQEIEKIFQPFYRFHKNEPWKNSTSGLELALVKEMVKRLRGNITVESFNQQITFTLQLPLERVF